MKPGRWTGHWALVPDSPADAVALYRLLREEIGRGIIGHGEAVDRLALMAVAHIDRSRRRNEPLLRTLLIGEDGVGKRLLGRAVARALDLPYLEIAASTMAELNWAGSDIGDFLDALYDTVLTIHPSPGGIEIIEQAIILVDGIDLLRLPGQYGSASTKDYQRGRQQSLLQLVGDGVVPIERKSGQNVYWPSRRALVICCGEFPGLHSASAGDLTDWGLLPELAHRLAEGLVLRLATLSRSDVVAILRRRTGDLAGPFLSYGYRLDVSEEALLFVADRAALGDQGPSPKAPLAWLRDASERILVSMLTAAEPPGSRRVLAPDDLLLPPRARGRWRD